MVESQNTCAPHSAGCIRCRTRSECAGKYGSGVQVWLFLALLLLSWARCRGGYCADSDMVFIVFYKVGANIGFT